MVFQVSSNYRMFVLANALVQVSCCVSDIICRTDHIEIYRPRTDWSQLGAFFFRGEDLADLLRLKDRLDLHSNFCAQILHFSFY